MRDDVDESRRRVLLFSIDNLKFVDFCCCFSSNNKFVVIGDECGAKDEKIKFRLLLSNAIEVGIGAEVDERYAEEDILSK